VRRHRQVRRGDGLRRVPGPRLLAKARNEMSVLGTLHLVEMAPQPKQRPRSRRLDDGRVMTYTPPETRAYEEFVGKSWRGPRAFTGAVKLTIAVLEGAGHPADLDNYVKVILDGLNKVAYADDRQVIAIDAKIHRGQERPAIDVIVEGWE